MVLQSPNPAVSLGESDLVASLWSLESMLFTADQESPKPGRPAPGCLARIKGKEKLNS